MPSWVKASPPPPSMNFQRISFTHEQLTHDADLLALSNTSKSEASNHDTSTKEHNQPPTAGMDITKVLASAHKLSKGDKRTSSGTREGNQMMWGRPHGYEVNVHERTYDPNVEWYLAQCSLRQQQKAGQTTPVIPLRRMRQKIQNRKATRRHTSMRMLPSLLLRTKIQTKIISHLVTSRHVATIRVT